MQKIIVTAILFVLATPAFACECHGVAGFGFGSFVAKIESQDCIPSHVSMLNGEITYSELVQNSVKEAAETPQEAKVESASVEQE